MENVEAEKVRHDNAKVDTRRCVMQIRADLIESIILFRPSMSRRPEDAKLAQTLGVMGKEIENHSCYMAIPFKILVCYQFGWSCYW